MKKRTEAGTWAVVLLAAGMAAAARAWVPGGGKPRIVGQSWNAGTCRGSITLDVSATGAEEAMAWLEDEYLSEYSRTLGVAVPADHPGSVPPAAIRILETEPLPGGRLAVEFQLVE
jgi:hypothetical protein